MICRLCEKNEKLVKAHIIPEAFYRIIGKPNELRIRLGTEKPPKVKKSPVGEYDKELLCESCEKATQVWDDYAIKFFIQNHEPYNKIEGDNYGEYRYVYESFNYTYLKLFIVSLLWRASCSNREFFSEFSLGQKYEKIAKKLILTRDPGAPDQFETGIMKFSPSIYYPNLENRPFSPRKFRFYGVNLCSRLLKSVTMLNFSGLA